MSRKRRSAGTMPNDGRDRCASHKRWFRSRSEARRFLRLVTSRGHGDKLPQLYEYDCPLCDGWHLSSQPPRNQPRRPVT